MVSHKLCQKYMYINNIPVKFFCSLLFYMKPDTVNKIILALQTFRYRPIHFNRIIILNLDLIIIFFFLGISSRSFTCYFTNQCLEYSAQMWFNLTWVCGRTRRMNPHTHLNKQNKT